MNITEVSNEIKQLLAGYDSSTLPINPNISGFVAQHTITYIVGSGKYTEDNTIELELRISIASEKRATTELSDSETERDLETLIGLIIELFHARPLKDTSPIQFSSFEISPPQSGKWRALLLFSIPCAINPAYETEILTAQPLTKIIQRRYQDVL